MKARPELEQPEAKKILMQAKVDIVKNKPISYIYCNTFTIFYLKVRLRALQMVSGTVLLADMIRFALFEDIIFVRRTLAETRQ